MKDVLHIYELTLAEIYIHTSTHELLNKHRKIKTVRVEATEITPLDELCQRLSYLLKCWLILNIFIRYTMYGGCLLRNMHLWVYTSCLDLFRAIGMHLNHRYLHNAIRSRIDTRSLKVEEYYRSFKL